MINQAIRDKDRAEGKDGGDQHENPGGVLAPGLDQRVNANRNGARAPRYRAGDHDGGAELAEGAREAKDGACRDTSRCERERDGPDDPPRPGAERRGDLLVAAVDLLDAGAPAAPTNGKLITIIAMTTAFQV